ncbi:MAG: hypothetical protein IJZ23_03120 [Roseburia sp.]|nr:hypothetical protein [Roseburia sp.]
MNTLKMKCFKSVLLYVILFWGMAIFFGIAAYPGLMNASNGPVLWDEVDFSGDIEGLYVTGTVYGIYDCYCEETEDGTVVAREYLTDADGYYYIALRAEGEDMVAADALTDATYSYFMGEDDGALLVEKQYEITGVIKEIPADSLEIFYEYLDWDNMDEESKATFLPYYIDINKVGNYDMSGTVIMAVATVIMFVIGLVFLVLVFTGGFLKQVKNYIKNSSNPELAREKVDNFVQNTPEVNGLRYNHEFICGNNKYLTVFGETSKVVWVYKQVVNHKRYFITVGKTYALALGFADGTRHIAVVKNEASADEHIQQLQQLCPNAVFGYSPELDKMFKKDFNQFLTLRYNAPEAEKQLTDY